MFPPPSSVASPSNCCHALQKCTRRTLTSTARCLDHYKTLGVPHGASKAQIKSHYYQLSKQHHPDISTHPNSKVIFTAASEAYAVLIDDRQRRAYDRSLLHRSAGPHQSSYSPRAPPKSGPRAKHAWEYTPRHRHAGFRQPPPDYTYTPPHRPRASGDTAGGAGRHYSPPQSAHHEFLRGSRRKEEETQQELDRVRNTSSLWRALQVTAVLVASIAVIGRVGK